MVKLIGQYISKKYAKKSPILRPGFFTFNSLRMSYFHTGIRTIIGAESFHGPVRDGKEWYQLAMVLRHNFLSSCITSRKIQNNQFIELISFFDYSTFTTQGKAF